MSRIQIPASIEAAPASSQPAAIRFARKVVETRGHIADADFDAVRAAGYEDAAIIEIVQHVALNVWTNYLNEVARTEIDFPVVEARAAA